jgi:ribonuclease HI
VTAVDTVVIHTDGASRGNPGPAAIGVVIQEPGGRILAEFGEALPPTTNNVAEYTAVIRALERAAELGAQRVQVKMDSQLVVRQLNGAYRVKHADMLPLYRRVLELIQRFDAVTFEHVPREDNSEADRLANQALDGVGESNESIVGRLFKSLVEQKTAEAAPLLAEEFGFQRATRPVQDAQTFLSRWPGKGGAWSVRSLRAAGAETILEASLADIALIWLCQVRGSRVERIREYRDSTR